MDVKSTRKPTENEKKFLNFIRDKEKRVARMVTIFIIFILVLIDVISIVVFVKGIPDMKIIITIGVINLILIWLIVLSSRIPGYQIVDQDMEIISGIFHSVSQKKKGKTDRIFFVGDKRAIIPAHWIEKLSEQENISAVAYNIDNGFYILLEIEGRLSVEEEMKSGKLIV